MLHARVRLAFALVLLALAAPRGAPASVGLRRAGAAGPVLVAAGLTTEERERLQYLREVEKVARDVYAALYERWGVSVFARIAGSEQHHTDAVRALIEKYGVADPAANTPPGVFVNDELQRLHDSLVRMGLASGAAALAVGVLMEETDVADLQEAMRLTSKTDLLELYAALLQGSNQHLAVFTDWSS